jgi:hypothetical protein
VTRLVALASSFVSPTVDVTFDSLSLIAFSAAPLRSSCN